jgi:excisionase family DNA binding protein
MWSASRLDYRPGSGLRRKAGPSCGLAATSHPIKRFGVAFNVAPNASRVIEQTPITGVDSIGARRCEMAWPRGRPKTISRAQRRKLADALRGIKRSDSTRQRLSAAHDLGLADRGEDSLREGSQEQVTRPTAVFMAGGWGDVHDASAYLGNVSVDVLYREIRRGHLQAWKVGGRKLVRLKREHVDAYMLAQQVAVPVKGSAVR